LFAQDSRVTEPASGLALDSRVVAALRERLPSVAEQTVAAVTAEVPGYAGALTGQMGTTIEEAVQAALGAFLRLAEQSRDSDPGTPLRAAVDGAYALGRGEARSGRSMDALLAAYRVGARVSWREFSSTAVASGLAAPTVAQFAELVFAYIDQLSAASVAGHADEIATSGRVRQRYLERLGQELLAGRPHDVLQASAERADWEPPAVLTAVLLPSAQLRSALALVDPRSLVPPADPAVLGPGGSVLLVPGADRPHLMRLLARRGAVVGPTRPWELVGGSYDRGIRAVALGLPERPEAVDTEEHLPALVLGADPDALTDLRARALAPLAGLAEAAAARLAETLRSWLLHQGRREAVAAELHVHPQTVRYRMTQLRELYGDALTDPAVVLELTLALAKPP